MSAFEALIRGMSSRIICLHSSFRSLRAAGAHSPGEAVDAFLDSGSTLLVPTFSWDSHAVRPPDDTARPRRNGSDDHYLNARPATAEPFTPQSTTIDRNSMGAVPAAVVAHPDRVRGDHPLCSFSAVGPSARELVAGQNAEDVFAPLHALVQSEGLVVLAGVDLTSMTLIHLAELAAGRRMFVRWGMTRTGSTPVRVGGCSQGFLSLRPVLTGAQRREVSKLSSISVYDARAALEAATAAIEENPEITRCDDAHCLRCGDSVAGGPEW